MNTTNTHQAGEKRPADRTIRTDPDRRRWTVHIRVDQIVEELSDPEDIESNPAGYYRYYPAAETAHTAREKALDEFHASVAIGCLDDFQVSAFCYPLGAEHIAVGEMRRIVSRLEAQLASPLVMAALTTYFGSEYEALLLQDVCRLKATVTRLRESNDSPLVHVAIRCYALLVNGAEGCEDDPVDIEHCLRQTLIEMGWDLGWTRRQARKAHKNYMTSHKRVAAYLT